MPLTFCGQYATASTIGSTGMDLADLGAFCVEPTIHGEELQRVGIEFRKAGQIKQIINTPIKSEARRYGWSIHEIAGDQAIDAFYAPPLYIIKFRGHKWS